MRPVPASPLSAISPLFGPTVATPSATSVLRFRCVALFAHIAEFIAGASRTLFFVASSTAVARSSAWPFAIFAMMSAVAGATTTRSVSRASRMCPTSNSEAGSNNSVKARSPAIAPTDIGVTNSCAARVSTTRTAMPRSRRRRIRSSDL